MPKIKVPCSVCGVIIEKHHSHLKRVKQPVCSYQCNGVLRGAEWKQHGHKGRAAWKPESEIAQKARMAGANNPGWKDGITQIRRQGHYNKKGLKYVKCPPEYLPMARKDGWVAIHRLLVAQAIGRVLTSAECVHHIDHNPSNNVLSNLMLFANNADHLRYEHGKEVTPLYPITAAAKTGHQTTLL